MSNFRTTPTTQRSNYRALHALASKVYAKIKAYAQHPQVSDLVKQFLEWNLDTQAHAYPYTQRNLPEPHGQANPEILDIFLEDLGWLLKKIPKNKAKRVKFIDMLIEDLQQLFEDYCDQQSIPPLHG